MNNIEEYTQVIARTETIVKYGKVTKVIGLTVESVGPHTRLGDICLINPGQGKPPIQAEVVGFRGQHVILMPLGPMDEIGPGCSVEATGGALHIKVGSPLLGQVLDGLGQPLSGGKLPQGLICYSTNQSPINPLERPPIKDPLSVGIRAIDGLLTIGKGQRVGIFAGSGVGKSTLMGMIARHTTADVNVIALIGERGREVREFIERDLGSEGRQRTVLVVATSDQPALQRIKGAFTATAIAEYFRDQGKDVLLMMDSVTRFAMAQREVGLAIGEPPTTKGYPPSVFALLPKLLERSGTSRVGSITAFYTVLVDGDDLNDPISDAVRGILDGHIVLDRQLAQKGHFPAIDVLASVSRVMKAIVSETHQKAAQQFARMLSYYNEAEDLINIGAYKRGSNRNIDLAVRMYPDMIRYLQQGINERSSFEESRQHLIEHFGKETDHGSI
ncbi:flagellar protein export ATPase FliI [Caldalkalibacillus uzonensis]|uniref:flagellar protein export ATPase FliI n=1 Tax=Caldalkalibacillus uzonensis TaxID=353224 RepID=UPI0027D8FB54|nr:flagellar protein export ATPase FliI [Caldalkalibacillus uzonensis]